MRAERECVEAEALRAEKERGAPFIPFDEPGCPATAAAREQMWLDRQARIAQYESEPRVTGWEFTELFDDRG